MFVFVRSIAERIINDPFINGYAIGTLFEHYGDKGELCARMYSMSMLTLHNRQKDSIIGIDSFEYMFLDFLAYGIYTPEIFKIQVEKAFSATKLRSSIHDLFGKWTRSDRWTHNNAGAAYAHARDTKSAGSTDVPFSAQSTSRGSVVTWFGILGLFLIQTVWIGTGVIGWGAWLIFWCFSANSKRFRTAEGRLTYIVVIFVFTGAIIQASFKYLKRFWKGSTAEKILVSKDIQWNTYVSWLERFMTIGAFFSTLAGFLKARDLVRFLSSTRMITKNLSAYILSPLLSLFNAESNYLDDLRRWKRFANV
eukprot:TRINITY_DN37_c0_g1_i7.p1 TRINITY_DN37_c0_g1~~TRINITY_DN37_c0_g1_i7.p1  ORF type:complete len:308 (+),score=29.50 TRINITY_DN37_c0_g1_i7:1049-1972(+)